MVPACDPGRTSGPQGQVSCGETDRRKLWSWWVDCIEICSYFQGCEFSRFFGQNSLYFFFLLKMFCLYLCLYAVKVRRHKPWSGGPLSWMEVLKYPRNVVHALSISLVNFIGDGTSLRITLKSTTLLFMHSSTCVNHETVTTELVTFGLHMFNSV